MREHGCIWDFSHGIIEMHGKCIKLIKKHAKLYVRHVYVREKVVVPPDTSMLVPVKMPLRKLSIPVGDWLVESKELKQGSVYTAHSLLPNDDHFAAIAIVNVSDIAFSLEKDRHISDAKKIEWVEEFGN